MFSQDSPFGIAAKVNASVIVEGLEKDLKESVGEKLNLLHRDHVQSDIDTLSLIQSINEALFTSQSLNEEIDDKVKRDEGYLAMEGLSGVRKLIGFGGIVLCVASELFHLRDNPQNIGLILCRCINRFPEQKGVCYIISALSSSLACSTKTISNCPVHVSPPYIPPAGAFDLSLPLTPTIPSPSEIPSHIVHAEIGTYYLLWKSVHLLAYNAWLATCNSHSPAPLTIPEWEILIIANLVEAKQPEQGERTPFAILSTRKNPNDVDLVDFLISVRGTATSSEWGIDFSYNLVLEQLRISPYENTPIHRGFEALASSVWSHFQLPIQRALNKRSLGLITITGHSLGGAVAATLAHFSSKQFPALLPDNDTPRTRAVIFAPGRAGGMKLMDDLSKTVVRTIAAKFDPVPEIPCNRIPGCSSDLVPIPTSRDDRSQFGFAHYPGIVSINPEELTPPFAVKGTNLNILAWHICSYDCWTSLHADPHHISSCSAPSDTSHGLGSVCPYFSKTSRS